MIARSYTVNTGAWVLGDIVCGRVLRKYVDSCCSIVRCRLLRSTGEAFYYMILPYIFGGSSLKELHPPPEK